MRIFQPGVQVNVLIHAQTLCIDHVQVIFCGDFIYRLIRGFHIALGSENIHQHYPRIGVGVFDGLDDPAVVPCLRFGKIIIAAERINICVQCIRQPVIRAEPDYHRVIIGIIIVTGFFDVPVRGRVPANACIDDLRIQHAPEIVGIILLYGGSVHTGAEIRAFGQAVAYAQYFAHSVSPVIIPVRVQQFIYFSHCGTCDARTQHTKHDGRRQQKDSCQRAYAF